MDDLNINRINELSKKSKTIGLTPEEKVEQKTLRDAYIKAMKGSLKSQLDSIVIVDEKGNRKNLRKDN